GPPPWGWTLALQSLVVLLGVGVVAWALTAPLLGDLRRLELAVGAFRDDDLTVRVPEVGAPMQPLASAINRLATRVEALVGGQRALLQAVSHELRTPLARLRFHLEELSEGPDPAAVAGADEELAELDGLIGELLTWLKAEVQDGPVVDVDVAAVVHRAVTRLVPEGLAVEVEVHAATARVAERDLERILDNLVSNACRYATAKVHIQASSEATELEVTVSDDGPGFPAGAERLLEPFTTADEARGVAGHGLGLSIVQRICGRYDGRVELGRDPKLGGGQVRVVLAQAVSE
ncbi:MAG: two-component sensor histidine kinase, partial [Proteobacteria bacterium]|nr:two-component sensor histidine kinase [Pseudomonadota bacterium]